MNGHRLGTCYIVLQQYNIFIIIHHVGYCSCSHLGTIKIIPMASNCNEKIPEAVKGVVPMVLAGMI